MTDITVEVHDPVLQPDSEPMLLDDETIVISETLMTKKFASPSTISEDNSPHQVPTAESKTENHKKRFLDVKYQLIKDAMGNIGDYIGQIDVETNLPHGQGEMKYSTTVQQESSDSNVPVLVASHTGNWENGYWQGHGSQTLNNGDSFVGEFERSVRTFGEYRWKDQETSNGNILLRKQRTYQGAFHENGRPHGHGKYTWTTLKIVTGSETSPTKIVSTYVGMFEDGQRQGHGIFSSSELQFTGDWEQGKYHGYGVLKIPSKKSTYRGHFHHGKKDGKGEEVMDDGTVIHEGIWRNDCPVRHQEPNLLEHSAQQEVQCEEPRSDPITLSSVFQTPQDIVDGEGFRGMYKGIVEESLPSGVGTITYEKHHHPTGIIKYEGFFDRGVRHGYGRADFGLGDHYQGNWNNGIFEGNGDYIFADGRVYNGAWKDGLPHDMKGRFTWPKFAVFEGRYEHGRRKSGRLGFADGSYYNGEFLSPYGTYGGHGKLVTLMISYEGEFRDGAFHGQGCLKKNSGFVIYEGEWKDGKALREDVMIAIPEDLLHIPLPPPDTDFGELDDTPETTALQLSKQNTINHGTHPTLSQAIKRTSSKFLEGINSAFFDSPGAQPKQEECKAVVDLVVSDSQNNPGRYTGILHLESQRPHGVGRMVYKDGNRIHEGFWSHGNREGHGRCMFAKIGDYHEGEYKQNLRHGPGKYYWKDGRQFIGNYHMDERSGEGKFIYPNGDVYVGNFEKGCRSGFGVFTYSQRTCSYSGEWKNSTYNGSGKLTWKTPKGIHMYEGTFKDGNFDGYGVEFLNDTLKRKGWWENGSYCGRKDPNEPMDLLSDEDNNLCGDTDDADPEVYGQPVETLEESSSKEECPTSVEQNYSDSRLQWKDSLEPGNA